MWRRKLRFRKVKSKECPEEENTWTIYNEGDMDSVYEYEQEEEVEEKKEQKMKVPVESATESKK